MALLVITLGSIASGCKKEDRLPGGGAAPTAPVTRFVPLVRSARSDFGEASGTPATIRNGGGSWGYSSGGRDVPPSIAKAEALVKPFLVEVAHVVDRQDAAAPPPRKRTHE